MDNACTDTAKLRERPAKRLQPFDNKSDMEPAPESEHYESVMKDGAANGETMLAEVGTAQWQTGQFVSATLLGADLRSVLQLVECVGAGCRKAKAVGPKFPLKSWAEPVPKHPQGQGYVVRAPKDRPVGMQATK